jgi:nucleotide-binding universal stress UspA family protein
MTISETDPSGPVLFCFDGSEGSRAALASAATLLAPRDAVVLTVWETVSMRLQASGLGVGLAGNYVADEGELDAREESTAREAAEQGARLGQARGWNATPRAEQATVAVWKTIVEVADAIDASLIVSGTRGRNPVKRALLGSVSEAVLHNSHRPTLIAPRLEGAVRVR